MEIVIIERQNGPKNLVAEAEVHFNSGFLAGTKLVGFSIWRNEDGELSVTLPSRSWGDSGVRKFSDLLRAGSGGGEALKEVKQAIVSALDESRDGDD